MRLRSILLARCPFWVLIAAWFCANTPQVASWHAILWIKNAQHFSHQAQLQSQVLTLLTGEAAESPLPVLAASDQQAAAPSTAVPADATIKKIPLSLETLTTLAPPAATSRCRIGLNEGPSSVHVADVPHPPPRV